MREVRARGAAILWTFSAAPASPPSSSKLHVGAIGRGFGRVNVGRKFSAAEPVQAYSSGAVVYIPLRMVSGIWSVIGVPGTGDGNLRAWLPGARHPIGYIGGQPLYVDASWYRFFDCLANIRLSGQNAQTVSDLVSALTDTQSTASAASSSVATASVQIQTNAEALAAIASILRSSALSGSDQIPEVRL